MKLAEKILRWSVQGLIIVGSITSLITFVVLFGQQIYDLAAEYLPIAAAIAIVLLLLGLYIAMGWWVISRLLRLFRHFMQRKKSIRHLKSLELDIARLVDWTAMRYIASQFNETGYDTYIDAVSSKQTELTKKLRELDIPSPENVKESPSGTILNKWAVFLDLLLVLAVTGRLEETRMLLQRIESATDTEVSETNDHESR